MYKEEGTGPAGPGGVARGLVVVASLVVVVAGLRAARPVVVPFIIAVFVAVACLPLASRLRRARLPAPAAVAIIVGGLIGVLLAVGAFVGQSLSGLARALPAYEGALTRQSAAALDALARYGVRVPERERLLDAVDPAAVLGVAAALLGEVGTVLAESVLVLLTVAFFLLEAAGFGAKLRLAFGDARAAAVAPAFAAFAGGVKQYLFIKTLVGLLVGTFVAVWLALLGIDFPILWGLFAFLLHYIPNIGAAVAGVPGVTLGLVQHGPGVAALAAVGYVAILFAIGNVLEPRWLGRGVGSGCVRTGRGWS